MFDVQYSLWKPCETVTRELFYRLIRSREVVENVNEARYYQRLIDENPSAGETQLKEWEKRKQEAKRRIPGLLFQATVEKSVSKNGVEGRWRKKSACRLNGLFILDVDHLDEAEPATRRDREIVRRADPAGVRDGIGTRHEVCGQDEPRDWRHCRKPEVACRETGREG